MNSFDDFTETNDDDGDYDDYGDHVRAFFNPQTLLCFTVLCTIISSLTLRVEEHRSCLLLRLRNTDAASRGKRHPSCCPNYHVV